VIRQLLPSAGDVDGAEALEAFYYVPPGRHIRADFVTSLDGAVEIGGRSRPLGGPADSAAFMTMRAVADAVLVGAGTVRAENYGPVRLDEPVQNRRTRRDQTALPRMAIVTQSAEISLDAKVFGGAVKPLLMTTARTIAQRRELSGVAELVECGVDTVDIRRVVDALISRGMPRILCEGGPSLLRSLLAEDLVDELCQTFSPVLAGSQHRRLTADLPLPMPLELRLDGLLEGDGLLLARYGRADQP
jgi:riboflavin biosynthesis pyrimidine reductase